MFRMLVATYSFASGVMRCAVSVMIVGGNIDGVSRVITTTIALETSKGDLPLALALGLVLLAIVGLINIGIATLRRQQLAGGVSAP